MEMVLANITNYSSLICETKMWDEKKPHSHLLARIETEKNGAPKSLLKSIPTQLHSFLLLHFNCFKENVQGWDPSLFLQGHALIILLVAELYSPIIRICSITCEALC